MNDFRNGSSHIRIEPFTNEDNKTISCILLHEIRQTEKDKYCMISLIHGAELSNRE